MYQKTYFKALAAMAGYFFLLLLSISPLLGQRNFHAWLSTCSHLIGPTGNSKTLGLAVDQSRGKYPGAPAFDWDVLIDVGDWTASQNPPDHAEGNALAKCLHESLGNDRGRYYSVSGNHDGEAKDWSPGEFTRKYVNPLGEEAYAPTSHFRQNQRPNEKDFRQLVDYPGTRWDRYLVRTGNVIWIMLGDRNEFDYLALARRDFSGNFQAGRGCASGMPKGGYPSGSVTLDTFEWWKKVVEDPNFSKDILVTAHHHMPAFTTITTDDGEPGNFHGRSGSVGPRGETGGQLYWIREYNQEGVEINQYAQTRPFINYLKDHPGSIAAWVGGHTHIHHPENSINGRGLHVRKYGVTFISIGALTDSHAGGTNQMTRMISFREGSDEALLNVYIHQSKDKTPLGWASKAARTFPLGKKFVCPDLAKNGKAPVSVPNPPVVPPAPEDPATPRYHWNLDHDQTYDFNNDKFIVGHDGSPYGVYEGSEKIQYSDDTPTGKGRSLDLGKTRGLIVFKAPYSPEMNWNSTTVRVWVKLSPKQPTEILGGGQMGKVGKFRLWYDGEAIIWEAEEKKRVSRTKMKINPGAGWHHLTGVADGKAQMIRLYVDHKLVREKKWNAKSLKHDRSFQLTLGAAAGPNKAASAAWLADDIEIYDHAEFPAEAKPTSL
jgi:hypothetical protein